MTAAVTTQDEVETTVAAEPVVDLSGSFALCRALCRADRAERTAFGRYCPNTGTNQCDDGTGCTAC